MQTALGDLNFISPKTWYTFLAPKEIILRIKHHTVHIHAVYYGLCEQLHKTVKSPQQPTATNS